MCTMCVQIDQTDACNFDTTSAVYARITERDDAASNRFTTATMSVGDSFVGNLSSAADSDWVEIQLLAGRTYDIALAGGTLVDSLVRLYDSNGTLVALDDDGGLGLSSLLRTTVSSSGTYYIEADGFLGSSGSYTLGVTAVGGGSTTGTVDDLANFLTDGFWRGNFERPREFSQNSITVDIRDLTADGQRLARWAFEAWERVADITFREVSFGADIDFSDSSEGAFANSTVDFEGQIMSSIVNVDRDWLREPANRFDSGYGSGIDSYSFQTYVHEIGHALGLGHQGQYNGAAYYGVDNTFNNDSWAMSVMSYFDQDKNSHTPATFARLAGPMIADVVAIQSLYGAAGAGSASAGNTVYGANSNVGGYLQTLFAAVSGERGSGNYSGDPIAFNVYDAGGIDLINLSYTRGINRIDLRPETFSDIAGGVHNMSIARGTVIENVTTGSGDDTIYGNVAGNTIRANDGLDLIFSLDGNDVIHTGGGSDTVYSGDGDDVVRGEGGWDELWTGAGADLIFGGNGNDAIGSGNDNDTLWGGIGDDSLYGGQGEDRLIGESGNDVIWTGAGNDAVDGGPGNDELGGYTGNDFLFAGDGDDLVYGGTGHDTVQAGAGDDLVYGWTQNDRIFGGAGEDTIYAGAGHDFVRGDSGNDIIYGVTGNDNLGGGFGDDTIGGGSGSDIFVFIGGNDRILDFDAQGIDRLDLRGFAPIVDYADLRADHVYTQGADLGIFGSTGNVVTLVGVSINDITANDFIF